MQRIISWLRSLFFPAHVAEPLSLEELQAAFRKRYANFRGLLTANNNALQAMAELEKIYYGGESYRMAVIRSKVTTILVNGAPGDLDTPLVVGDAVTLLPTISGG